MYTYVAVFSFLHPRRCTYVYMLRACLYYDTCAPLLPHVRASTSTSMYVHVRDQNDNATYASTRWVPTVTHFLPCEDVAGGSQQSGGNIFFSKYDGPSSGSPLSGGGIIIFRVIRRHFLAAAVDPAVSLSTYSPRPMEVVPSMLTTPRREHQGGGRRRGLGRGRHGAGEDAAVDAHVDRSTRVHWFDCDVRLPSPQGLAIGGTSRG